MPEASKAPRRRSASSRPSTPTISRRASPPPSSRARAPTSSTSSTTGRTSTRTPSSDVSDVANELGKAEGGFYEDLPASLPGQRQVAGPASLHRRQCRRAIGSRGSKEAGANEYPKTWDDARKVFTALKKKGKPYGQTLGHTFGDAPTFTYTMLWAFGGAGDGQDRRKKVVLSSKGAVESVKFMQAFWKDCCDEGGLAWDDTNNNRAFHAGEISATLNGAEHLHRRQAAEGKDQGRQGRADVHGHRACARCPAGPSGSYSPLPQPVQRPHEVLEEPEARQGLPALGAQEGELRQVVHRRRRGTASAAPRSGRTTRCGPSSTSRSRCSGRPPATRGSSAMPGRPPQRRPRLSPKYVITDMYAKGVQGMKAEDAVEVGRRRARRRSTKRDHRSDITKETQSMTTDNRKDAASTRPQVDRADLHQDHGRGRGRRGGGRPRGDPGRARAPAYAQGTRLNIVRWVDFIPACDVELKRQAPEASKALGAEVVFEFINANDLQARITAAMQSGAGPDIIQMLHNWPHLYAERARRRERSRRVAGAKSRARFYALSERQRQGGRQVAGPAARRSCPASSPTGSRGSTRSGPPTFPKTYEELRQVATKLKKKGKPYGQTLGHTFGDAPAWAYPLLWNFGGDGGRQERQERRDRQQGRGGGGQVHDRLLEGQLRRGRPGLGRHQQQPGLPGRRDLRHAERSVDLHRGQARAGQDQGRQGRADGA